MDFPENKPSGFNWASLLQSFQRLKYTSPIGMLTLAIVAIALVFGLLAYRIPNSPQAVQITMIVCFTTATMAFFSAVVLVIRKLGVWAALSGTQVIEGWKMEMGAKGLPSPPETQSITGHLGATSTLEP